MELLLNKNKLGRADRLAQLEEDLRSQLMELQKIDDDCG
jgi:hypothetical protein